MRYIVVEALPSLVHECRVGCWKRSCCVAMMTAFIFINCCALCMRVVIWSLLECDVCRVYKDYWDICKG